MRFSNFILFCLDGDASSTLSSCFFSPPPLLCCVLIFSAYLVNLGFLNECGQIIRAWVRDSILAFDMSESHNISF
ncbi:unnamed protein product [Prunus brigantina]